MAQERALVMTGSEVFKCEACREISVTVKADVVQENQGEKLYHCSKCNQFICEDCGVFLHRKNKKGHSFDIEGAEHVQTLQQMMEKKEDAGKFGSCKQLVIKLVGEENYKRIVPYLTASNALGSASIGGIVLLSDLANNVGGLIRISSSHAAKFGGIGVAVLSGLEICYAGYRWYRGDICGKEFVRLVAKTGIKGAATFGGVAAGAKMGAVIGTATCPGFGTAVGIIGGALIGFLCGWGASKIYDWFFPNGEQAARKKAVEDALQYFLFDKKDIKKKHIFNKKELRRRYKQYALNAHPDRNDGETQKWTILSGHYGTLTALLEETSKQKKNQKIVNKVLAIQN